MSVTLVDVLPPEIAICDVEWTAPSGEQLTARIRVRTPIEDLPKPTPVEGVAGLLEGPHLPAAVQVEAVARARILAEQFNNREF